MTEDVRDFVDKVLVLQSHLENTLPDEIWEAIPVHVWNNVSCHAVVQAVKEENRHG